MDINDLIATLTEGLPADQAAIVKAAIERDAVKSKATGWKQQAEYDALNARTSTLQEQLEGGPNKLGAKAYQEWYEKNYAAVQQLQADRAAYEAKYGKLDAPIQNSSTTTPKSMTPEEVQAEVDKRVREQYAPNWSNIVLTTAKLMQRHLRNKRTTDVDFDALAKTANEKYKGDLERAYEEWDKPEQEKAAKAATDAEVERRVKEEIQKRGAPTYFPANNEPSSLTSRSKADIDKFDRNSLQKELLDTFVGAGSKEQVQ